MHTLSGTNISVSVVNAKTRALHSPDLGKFAYVTRAGDTQHYPWTTPRGTTRRTLTDAAKAAYAEEIEAREAGDETNLPRDTWPIKKIPNVRPLTDFQSLEEYLQYLRSVENTLDLGTPLGNLAHVVDMFEDNEDDSRIVLQATSGIFDQRTGLTLGDLRAILKYVQGKGAI